MTKKIADLCVKVGSYESAGKTKNRYLNVGRVLQTDNGGKMYLLDKTFNPAGCPSDGRDTVILSVFDVKEDAGNHKGYTTTGELAGTADDEQIPF